MGEVGQVVNGDLARCDQEIHAAQNCHTDRAYLVAIWEMDWTVERELIQKDQERRALKSKPPCR